MKKLLMPVGFILILLVLSCEPESAMNVIADVNEAMSNPNSSIQLTAENLQEMITTGTILVQAVPGFPYAKAILGRLAVAQAVLAIILGWRKHTTTKALKVNTTALEEVVWGNEILKKDLIRKGTVDMKDFRDAQNTAQNAPTVELVNKIRKNVA